MYRDEVTIFCKHETDNGDIWYPYFIKGVDVNRDRAWIAKTYGQDATASINLHIPCDIDNDNISIAGYNYLSPTKWKNAQNKTKAMTLCGGENYSIILLGDYDFTTAINDNDYTKGFYHYLATNYDGVYAVVNVSQYSVIPHFEVTGR